ncbi:MAG: hypothetical protein ACFB2X_08200 [Rivularia sp. (in: cyanobacteria)]
MSGSKGGNPYLLELRNFYFEAARESHHSASAFVIIHDGDTTSVEHEGQTNTPNFPLQ